MPIRATFKDYYDSAAGMGIDTTIVYPRETCLADFDLKTSFRKPKQDEQK